MKKLIATVGVAAALTAATAGQALAQGGDHNCAGATSSSLAQTLGGDFGDSVSDFAQLQFGDNFGLANCSNANGKNP